MSLERRAAYDALCAGEYARGEGTSFAFCVYTDDLDEGRGDIYVAAGMALELARLGHGVRLVPRWAWAEIDDVDVVVAMLPDLDPSLLRPGVRKVAWVRNEVERWCRMGSLSGYHQVFASSALAVARLQRETDRVWPEPLPIAADDELFVLPPAGVRSTTAVTTANYWGSLRDVHKVLVRLPVDADVVMYGAARNAPPKLRRWHRGARSYFDLPEVYGQSSFVIDDVNRSNVGFGALNSRLYESAACGALPLLNTRLGLADQGFGHLPTYRDAGELSRILRRLREDPAETARLADLTRATVLERHTWKVRAGEFLTALAAGEEHDAPPAPRPVHYFPDYWTNPYQPMLFSALPSVGSYAVPVPDATEHLRTRAQAPGHPGVLNIQWPDPILQPSRGPFSARLALDEFAAALAAFKQRGGHLVWTVHNVLPHEAKFQWAEVELGQLLADEADVVHLLSAETIEQAAPYYRIDPAKAVVIEHSSYDGRYPTWISREGARERLGLEPHEKAIIALGGVRPYKGLDKLVAVFDELHRDDPSLRLLIAGRPGKLARSAKFESDCLADPRIIAFFDFVPDDQLQVWMKAADLAVLNYRNILNSGSFLLSQTFGLPVVAPRAGALRAFDDQPQVRLFDTGDDAGLRRAIAVALDELVVDPEGAARARTAAHALAAERSPQRMAREFADVVAGLDG
ncbi:glycosyltransferase [Nocardioides sp. ChNu-153]|uniref:glycosyltransferase family protein n=1 Tax=unclassified Nocardioides TaxID=2615069 RepID=UPI0024074FC8|nr:MULTISPECIES: glycosyltransferase [unclassified Nocardioides]MDF9718003.1 glycosyltransferase [Nocardioides sp. ChNu-99]MDN7120938.1 glycosyltransferase [Nocardioides sp. ChNu-153]